MMVRKNNDGATAVIERGNPDDLRADDLRDLRNLRPERPRKIKLEGFGIGVNADGHRRASLSDVTVKLDCCWNIWSTPHWGADHNAIHTDFFRFTCLPNRFSCRKGTSPSEHGNAAARSFYESLHEIPLFIPGQRCRFAKRTERQNSIDASLNQLFDNPLCLVEINRI